MRMNASEHRRTGFPEERGWAEFVAIVGVAAFAIVGGLAYYINADGAEMADIPSVTEPSTVGQGGR